LRKQDPSFDFYEFENKVTYIFKTLLLAFYRDDIKTIELLAGEIGSAMLIAIIKERISKKVELMYKEMLFIDDARYHDSIIDGEEVRLQFMINVQEALCLIDKNDKSIKDGSPTKIENCHYLVEIMKNPEPKEELVGHNWVITKVIRTGVVEQLI